VWPGIKLIEGVWRRRAIRSSASAAAGCCRITAFSPTKRCRERNPPAAPGEPGSGARRHGAGCRAHPRNGHREDTCFARRPNGQARQQAIGILDEILEHLRRRCARHGGSATQRNFFGPIQTIIPWASNLYTETLIREVRADLRQGLLGLLDAGRHVGRRHGLHLRSRGARPKAQSRLGALMRDVSKQRLRRRWPSPWSPWCTTSPSTSAAPIAELKENAAADFARWLLQH
jgi:hypothetical protein